MTIKSFEAKSPSSNVRWQRTRKRFKIFLIIGFENVFEKNSFEKGESEGKALAKKIEELREQKKELLQQVATLKRGTEQYEKMSQLATMLQDSHRFENCLVYKSIIFNILIVK